MSLLAFVPRTWAIVAVSALAISAASIHTLQATRARTRAVFVADSSARAFVRDSMTMAASAQVAARAETVTVRAGRVDTLFRRVKAKAETVTVIATRIPDTVLVRFPVVDTLRVEATGLAVLVPALRDSVESERTARDSLARTLGLQTVAVRDSLHVEQKRPKRTWRSSTILSGAGAVLGATAVLVLHRK